MNYFEIIRRRRESVCNNKCEPIELMHDYVSSVLESNDLQMCQTVYLSLVNHDYQKGHILRAGLYRAADQLFCQASCGKAVRQNSQLGQTPHQ